MPAGLFSETIDLAQTKAGALTGFLCRKKGLEGMIEDVRGHPSTSVRYANDDILAWGKFGIYPAILLVS